MTKLAFTPALGAAAISAPRRNAAFRRAMGLLRLWRKHAHSRRRLCELNDHILQDIGLTRDALLREATRPVWE
jgi:uncharacterized protein YjiS (DUF1127 family)